VRIEASAREPGARAKIAVSSRDRDVDPVGACVGMKGSRVQAVVQELRGEKIDIVPYSEDPARFVCNAIAPAEVSRVLIDAETHTMELIVPDDKLSLAIGKKGQNVRLASQLTGWRIDIHSESKVKELEAKARRSLSLIEDVDEDTASTLFKLGWRSAQDVMNARPDDIAKVPGMGGLERATRIVEAAAKAVEEEKKRAAEEAARLAEESKKSDRERLLALPRIDESVALRLEGAGYRTVQALAAEESVVRLCEAVGLDEEHGRALHHAARLYVAEFATILTEPVTEQV
jgi:N utilization substance protein A